MDMRNGILQTANALGMDPLTLATIISYETAGTFDPTKRGPTTQWGQHRGLIQFGEPQAEKFGVNWDDPIASQLGADGAVAKYFRAHGWKPGMSELQAYATVNAGSPYKVNASDANNGGAPGTVTDKVNDQFGPHRAKAARMMGGDFTFPGLAKMDPGVPTAKPGVLDFLLGGDPQAPLSMGDGAPLGQGLGGWGLLAAMGEDMGQGQASAPLPAPPRPGALHPDTFRRQDTGGYIQGLLAALGRA